MGRDAEAEHFSQGHHKGGCKAIVASQRDGNIRTLVDM